MSDLLCPTDKNPCVRERCAIWCRKDGRCSWVCRQENSIALKETQKAKTAEDHSAYRAHLFD